MIRIDLPSDWDETKCSHAFEMIGHLLSMLVKINNKFRGIRLLSE